MRLHDGDLAPPPLSAHFYSVFRGNESRAPGFEDAGDRLWKWQRLCAHIAERHPDRRGARNVRFLLDDLDLSAGPHRPRRLRERPLFACEPPVTELPTTPAVRVRRGTPAT